MKRGPFIRVTQTTGAVMSLVFLALLPAAGAGIYHYGLYAGMLLGISIASALVSELLFELITRRKLTFDDYSWAVTGLILGLILPPSVPLYFPAIGAAAAIIGAKMLFGGIGRNILNPAAAGKLLLLVLFRPAMNDFSGGSFDAVSPLQQIVNGNSADLLEMITGNIPANIGTGCVIAILAGAAFLAFAGVIDLRIPACCVISFVLSLALFERRGPDLIYYAQQLCGGSFLFTAFFMATDYTTSPLTGSGRCIFGLLLGASAAFLRHAGFTEEACILALLLCNLLSRPVDIAVNAVK